MLGTIDRLAPERGFGFISSDDGQEFFFHRGALQATDFEELAPGTRVVFEAGTETHGDEQGEHPRAVNIRLAPGEAPAVDHEILPEEKKSA
jgi:CspA family cold shock protein